MSTHEARVTQTLRDYVRTLLRRKAIVVGTAAAALAVSLFASYSQTPRYASVAKLLLQSRPTQSQFTSESQSGDPGVLVETEIEIISTEPVQELVKQKIGDVPPVKVAQVGFTNLITIRATSTAPRRAAVVANAYADSYIEYRRKQALDDLAAGSTELQNRVADLQKQLDDLSGQLEAAPACVDTKTTAAACAQRAIVEQSVTTKRTTLLNQQALFRQRLDQAQVDRALTSGGAQVVTPATPSGIAYAPTPKRSGAVALMVGLMVGIGLALTIEHLDDSIKGKEDLERAVPSLPVVSIIPVAAGGWKSKDDPKVTSITEPASPAAEAYRTLRTAIQFLGVDRPVRTLQVTSASAQEGKTTTVANLGVALARAGASVVIVCADLRRPRVNEFFGISNAVGFTSVLLGEVSLADAVQRVPDIDRLYLLPSGPLPPNPAELLQSQRATEILTTLQAQRHFILIDSPPILPVTDGLVISKRVDGTLIVVSAGRTTRKQLERTVEVLRQVDAPVIGAVLNGVPGDSSYSAAYGYKAYSPATAVNGNGAKNGTSDGHKRRRSKPAGRRS